MASLYRARSKSTKCRPLLTSERVCVTKARAKRERVLSPWVYRRLATEEMLQQ